MTLAQETNDGANASETIKHRGSNGALLEVGDSVPLTKDLNVKGTSFTAKRGSDSCLIYLIDKPILLLCEACLQTSNRKVLAWNAKSDMPVRSFIER